ncbi:hypothetical protein HYZ97_02695 [Candidatus Pacearchaeota archaeon]|nr:hypothetical protein [Candidatus Pacearchaeota archaeon]
MENIYLKKTAEIKKERIMLEERLRVRINVKGKAVSFKGEPVDEFEAMHIFEAVQFGFTLKDALLLLEPDMQFRKLHIKDFTRRKNLYEVRSRIIGREGKTKRTIEDISDCVLVLNENTLGIIGSAEAIDTTLTALKSLIGGSKEGNVYRYLERMNAAKKDIRKKGEDLGLKNKK